MKKMHHILCVVHGSSGMDHNNSILAKQCAEIGIQLASLVGEPSLERVIQKFSVQKTVCVVPYLLSKGHTFNNKLLPVLRALNQHNNLYLTPPVGELEEFADSLIRYCTSLITKPSSYALALIGHGTKRNSSNRTALTHIVSNCRKKNLFAAVEAFYLEEEPFIHEIEHFFGLSKVLAVPVFFSMATHVEQDIVQALKAKHIYLSEPICHLLDHQVIIDHACALAKPILRGACNGRKSIYCRGRMW